MRAPLLALVLLVACKGEAAEDTEVYDTEPEQLVIPDLTGVDMVAAYQAALRLAVQTDLRTAWATHVRALTEERDLGCPDVYAGNPDVENIDGLDDDAPGLSWRDFCVTGAGRTWGGFAYWENEITASGDPDTAVGRDVDATRLLFGDGILASNDEVWFEFDGEGSDSVSRNDAADGFSSWRYASSVRATVTGLWAFAPEGSPTPGGYRTDIELEANGGNADRLEVRGNLYMFEQRIADRFDSVALDMAHVGTLGAGPDDCLLEPRGWIGIRDEDAFWYDLVFLPRYEDNEDGSGYDDPLAVCDGCGTLYIRGLQQPQMEVCVSFDFLWEGALEPPALDEFAFTVRDLGED